MTESDLVFLAVAGPAVLAGAAVQGSVGLGLALVAAPVVAMLDPTLMPGTLLVLTAVLPLLTVGAEWRHADLRGVSWALAGRLVGTVAGVWVVALAAPETLGLAVGVAVLLAVAASLSPLRIGPTPAALGVAGVVSGVMGTATSIGGPPVALVYQHESGPRVRATLGCYFLVGVLVSLAALALGGQLRLREVAAGCALLPFMVAGFLLSGPLRRVLGGARLRAALLAVVALSGAALVVRALL
ncbi:sulfite exporter TauE/SafE family protein [Thermobifida cellulosilytica]|uniref:Probable membrane transporter protein n=1 Tax=Thermobifida cellulosilytica TB100 TaxID=665004 RepID=A0A147KK50_THECS|nr:sulfite exporter TauE/SafE family protein [Thermobifida cellulosilytica]KUP97682.1 sulfite exporter TauE/SafE family protein [Thermobifida cellulosilytica TB100]